MDHRRRALVWVVAFAVLGAAMAGAQTTGSIEGTVFDEGGVALPGVTVEMTSAALQGSRIAVTDGGGQFRAVLLPPGEYDLVFTLSGFATTETTGVRVGLGRTVTLRVEMSSAFSDEVVVSGAAPAVDVRSTEIGVNIDRDVFSRLPMERNYASVIQVTPGAGEDDSGATIYGSTGAENVYYIDGVNTTGVELGQQGKRLNFEFIEELQVKTGGYQAEYGRATGGVVNVITRSGGNDFHGDAFAYVASDNSNLRSAVSSSVWDKATNSSRSYLVSAERSRDFGVDLGGYLVRDRLWFFGAYDKVTDQSDRTVLQDFTAYQGPSRWTVYEQERKRDLWAANLSWRPTQNHSVKVSAFADPTDETGPFRSMAGPETTFMMDNEVGGTDATLKYEGVLGQSLVVTAQAAKHEEKDYEDGPGADIIWMQDLTTDINGVHPTFGGLGFFQKQKFTRDIYRADLSYFVNDLAGDHELKVGGEFEDIGVENANFASGGQRIYKMGNSTGYGPDAYYRHRFFVDSRPSNCSGSASATPEQRAGCYLIDNGSIVNPLVIDTKSENLAFFLQDSWRPLPNVTLNLGLRWEKQDLFNAAGDVQQSLTDQWAPRLGFVWDPTGTGASKVYGSWGRFYETIPMDIVIRSYGGEISAFYYNFNGALDDPDRTDVACDPALDQAYLDASGRWRCSVLGGGFSDVDPDTKGQYIDELLVGGEYEVVKDLALGAKYIRRDLGRVMEDSLSGDGEYLIGNPGEGYLASTVDMSYSYTFPVTDPKRTFTGVELSLRKRFSNNWGMVASYLWSELKGNYDGTFQASTGQLDPNLNSAFDYAEFQFHNSGYLSNDRRHQFKVDATYGFDFGLNLGLSAYYRTGVPITAYGYSGAYQNWEFYLSERGAFGRTADEYEADLHVGYPFRVGPMEINLLLDVFNVFNRQGETGVDMRYNLAEINSVLDYETGEVLPAIAGGTPCTASVDESMAEYCNESFGVANSWQDPRSIRLGVRVTF